MSPGIALWNQRHLLREKRSRIVELLDAVGRPDELTLLQAMGLMAVALEFRPDSILELGRLYGNSTAMFAEVADTIAGDGCRVTSICFTPNWDAATVPRLRGIVGERWFRAVDARREDILTFDYQSLFSHSRRVMVFWDAHGYSIANCVLGRILPIISTREHVVALHDISDARYLDAGSAEYGGRSIWTHNDWTGRHLRLGWLHSNVEQAVALYDFASRNDVELESATHSLRTELSREQLLELDEMLGLDAANTEAGWLCFTLHGSERRFAFPEFSPPRASVRLANKTLIAGLAIADKLRLDRPARAVVQASRRLRR